MTIGELSLKSGVPASTLRYWERIQLLPHPARVSGQRRYGPDAIHLIAALRLARACGFSLIEMRRLVDGFRPETPASERWQTAIGARMQALKQQMTQLNDVQRLLERVQCCQCIDLSECGRRAPSMLTENSASLAT